MEIDPEHLHHAYLIESAPDAGERFLMSLFHKIDFSTTGNPDYHVFEAESFLVDDARLLNVQAQSRAFGNKKIFVIKSQKIHLQAQNALLKTFEEPGQDTHFFIIFSERDLLLPTLLSRLQIVRIQSGKDEGDEAETFLSLTPPERFKFIKKFLDRNKLLAPFLDSLLGALKRRDELAEIKKVFDLRAYASDVAASPRLILEHLALVLK